MKENIDTPAPNSTKNSKNSELIKRVISGIIMAGVSLALTFWRPEGFNFLVMVGAGLMSWEWSRIVHSSDGTGALVGERRFKFAMAVHLLSVTLGILLFILFGPLYGVGALVLGAFAQLIIANSVPGWLHFLGPLYTGLPALALIWLRGDTDYGVAVIIFLFLVVWMADIAAYGFGRTFGGPKLAPGISPNKTWSGALGGLAGSALVGVGTAYYLGNSSFTMLFGVALVLAVASQLGDLFESSIKRRFGVKDSSNLIPGHGGILDRVDGLIAAACLGGLIALLNNADFPGRAILIW